MGSNGIVKETAFLNVDKKKFDKGYKKAFGERKKIDCIKCDLSSRQKENEAFECPHCGEKNDNGSTEKSK